MVETTQQNSEMLNNKEEVLFYEKSSGFVTQREFNTASPLKNHMN